MLDSLCGDVILEWGPPSVVVSGRDSTTVVVNTFSDVELMLTIRREGEEDCEEVVTTSIDVFGITASITSSPPTLI